MTTWGGNYGGAVAVFGTGVESQRTTVTNCLFWGNRADCGGALALGGMNATVNNCTISSNTATSGGGLYLFEKYSFSNPYTHRILNTIISDNENLGIYEANANKESFFEHCLFNNNTGGDLRAKNGQVYVGAHQINSSVPNAHGNVGGDPLFVNRAAGDFHLQNGSAALDRASTPTAAAQDFEGDPRPGSDGLADIGADEADSAYYPANETDPPVSSVSALPPFRGVFIFDIPYTAYDNASGVAFVELFFRKDQGAWTQYGTTFTLSPIVFDCSSLGNGLYEFFTVATDRNHNREAAPALPDAATRVIKDLHAAGRVYVDADAVGQGTGESGANAVRELVAAFQIADVVAIREIWVAEGSYLGPVALRNGMSLYGGFHGMESDLSERNLGAYPTVVGVASYQYAFYMNSITSAWLDGFTIRTPSGSALSCANLPTGNVVTNCIFRDSAWEGAVECVQSSLSFVNCTFVNNAAYPTYPGGAVACQGGSPTFTNCVFLGNTAWGLAMDPLPYTPNYGGALYFLGTTATLRDCLVLDNRSNRGGGIYALSSRLNVEQTILAGNAAIRQSGGFGGWIDGIGAGLACTSSTVSLFNCAIVGSRAADYAGAFYCNGSTLALRNCTVADNMSPYSGGGLFCRSGAKVLLSDTVFARNSQYAIYEGTADADATVTRCLFFANPHGSYFDEATTGYSLASQIDLNVAGASGNLDGNPAFATGTTRTWTLDSVYDPDRARTILTDTSATFAPNALVGQLIKPNTAVSNMSIILENTTTSIVSAGNASAYAKAGDTYQLLDYHLGSGSAAIDASTSAGALLLDLDGDLRPIDIAGVPPDGTGWEYDLGAYEAQHADIQVVPEGPLYFGIRCASVGPSPPQSVTLINRGFESLNFVGAGVAVTGPNAADFHVVGTVDTSPMNPGALRTINLAFDPQSPGFKQASLTITTSDPDASTVTVALRGRAVAATEVDIFLGSTPIPNGGGPVDFGVALRGSSSPARTFTVSNSGATDLYVADLSLPAGYSLIEGLPPLIHPGQSDTFTVALLTNTTGTFSGTIRLATNDADENPYDFSVTGIVVTVAGDGDQDGISDDLENGAPNGDDGNADGTADRLQANVASLRAVNGSSVTLVSPPATALLWVQVTAVNPAHDQSLPAGYAFPLGFFHFTVTGIPAGGNATVHMLIHSGPQIDKYFKYGRQPEDGPASAHWFGFVYDGSLGCDISGSTLTLLFRDGQRGDLDLLVNGRIADPGGPAVNAQPSCAARLWNLYP